mmetsp:Transcript_120306/g.218769  ORF Transcript_120306/g.218769 Transcript_120306/m.218769 type:complete len:87 (+) Transcript_120306:134-394(+)
MSGWINWLSFKSASAHVPAREKGLSHDTNDTPAGTPTQGQNEGIADLARAPVMAKAKKSAESAIVPRRVFQQDGSRSDCRGPKMVT